MNAGDFKDIALLWQEEPSLEEQAEFRGLTERAARRAYLIDYAELGLGLLLIVAVIIAMLLAPGPATLLIGGLSIAALVWSSWKRHVLTQTALMLDTSDRRAFVEHAALKAQAKLRRSLIGLWLFFPGMISGAALTYILRGGGDVPGAIAALIAGASRWPHGPAVIFLLLVFFGATVRNHLRLKAELANLRGLSEDYREEARLDALALR